MRATSILAYLLPAALFASSALGDATILFCNTESCTGSCSTQTVTGDGTCRQLGGIKSADTLSLDGGCSVTVYSDSNCSVGAFAAGLNSCVFSSSEWNSYSYDC
ncbi:hypothetical protein VTN00DRAFT_4991 [Thermoascus crustaceus]|uniref:uncharacterized protein n=1 Tax=Thermoascus crustaceus TaxID=5088 RepID=UPI00374405EF